MEWVLMCQSVETQATNTRVLRYTISQTQEPTLKLSVHCSLIDLKERGGNFNGDKKGLSESFSGSKQIKIRNEKRINVPLLPKSHSNDLTCHSHCGCKLRSHVCGRADP